MRTIFLLFIVMLIGLFVSRQKTGESLLITTDTVGKNLSQLQEDFKIYHTPGETKITVWHYSQVECKGQISIYFSDGRLLQQRDVTLKKHINTWNFNLPSNASGILFVKLRADTIMRTAKIYKQP